jgi:hypothetical protein
VCAFNHVASVDHCPGIRRGMWSPTMMGPGRQLTRAGATGGSRCEEGEGEGLRSTSVAWIFRNSTQCGLMPRNASQKMYEQ